MYNAKVARVLRTFTAILVSFVFFCLFVCLLICFVLDSPLLWQTTFPLAHGVVAGKLIAENKKLSMGTVAFKSAFGMSAAEPHSLLVLDNLFRGLLWIKKKKKGNIESRKVVITAVFLLISSCGEALMIITSKVENPAGILSDFFFLYFIKFFYFH